MGILTSGAMIITTPEHLTVSSSREGVVCRLMPIGELDIATAPILEASFDAVYGDDSAEMIVLDLTELSFIDSMGIHLLLRMHAACKDDDRLRIVGGSRAVVRVLDVSGVHDRLPIISHESDPLVPLWPTPPPTRGGAHD